MKLANLHATSRLQEVYILWHKSVEAYEKPDEFRTNLNACVQAIRNVTFILQSQKSEIEDFEKWYSPWQNAMKNDKIMRWCVEARNIIVKAGDIEKNSMAIVSYVASYFEPPKWHLIVDPFPSATEIAHYVTRYNRKLWMEEKERILCFHPKTKSCWKQERRIRSCTRIPQQRLKVD